MMIIQNTQIEREFPASGTSLLPEWGLIFVEGPEAASFLQNQLTNSVLGLSQTFSPQIAQTSTSVRLVGYCSPKGRLLASAWLGLFPPNECGEDRFALFISRDVAASTAKRLAMYILRSKVKVIDVADHWDVCASYLPSDEIVSVKLGDGQIGIRLPDVRYNSQLYCRVLFASENSAPAISVDAQALGVLNDMEVLSGIPRIVRATQEQFVPQMINFESVYGIDFKKGCYPGQEIVARSQYRGVIKRRLFLAHLLTDRLDLSLAVPGAELFHSLDASQPAGMVVLASPNPFEINRIDFQIECKVEAIESGEICLGSADGPVLKIDSLPYSLIDI